MLLVASETGHVYTFATRKLQPMITSDAGKALIQTCLNSPDPGVGSTTTTGNNTNHHQIPDVIQTNGHLSSAALNRKSFFFGIYLIHHFFFDRYFCL